MTKSSSSKNCFNFFQASILEAIKESNHEFLTDLLTDEKIKSGFDINHCYPDPDSGKTLLHLAIEIEDVEAVRLLVASGANCNIFSKSKSTAFHTSARKGNVAIMQILLGSGKAEVNAVTSDGKSVLHILAKKAGKDTPDYRYSSCILNNF